MLLWVLLFAPLPRQLAQSCKCSSANEPLLFTDLSDLEAQLHKKELVKWSEVKCRCAETDSNMWPNQFGGVAKKQETVFRAEWRRRSKRCHCSRLHLHRSECCLVLCCDIGHTDEELLFHMHKCQSKQPKTNEKLLLWWAELLLPQLINQRQFSTSDAHCQSTTMNWLEQQSTDDVQINDCKDTKVNFGKGSDSLS